MTDASRRVPNNGCGEGTSTALVHTDAAFRYAKQLLLSHVGHKATAEDVASVPHAQRLVLAHGTGEVRPEGDRLVLDARAADADSLAVVEEVLTRHLGRFGSRRRPEVSWGRADTDATPP